jgi:hypothetical protein
MSTTPHCEFCRQSGCSCPLVEVEGNRLLCPECRSPDLDAYITNKRHQVILRCRCCSRIASLRVRSALPS